MGLATIDGIVLCAPMTTADIAADALLDTQAPDPDELDQVYSDYQAITNMGAAELRRWKDNPCSSAAGVDKSPIDRNIELKSTKKDDWTEKHIRWANRTISFVSRMMGNKSGDPVSEECPDSKRNYSLKNWARDVHKKNGDSMKSTVTQDLGVKDLVTLGFNPTADEQKLIDKVEQDLAVELTRVFQSQIAPMGKPSPERLAMMNRFRPLGRAEYTADEMVSVPLMCSNNLLTWGGSRWAIDAVNKMADTYADMSNLLNHDDGDVKESVGFVYDAEVISSNAVPRSVIEGAGEAEYNEIIVKTEGYHQLVAYVAIAADHPILNALSYNRISRVSTGCITDGTYRCPFDNTEFDMNTLTCEEGHYHPLARWYMRLREDDVVAPYYIKDGVISSYELSFVVVGNLPAASIPKAG
jgi:hypothetical protein